MPNKLSGYVCIRNGIIHDYCFVEAVHSLIPVCDEVVISVGIADGETDDGTIDKAIQLEKEDSRVRVLRYPWDNPHRDVHFWVRWLNWTRQRVSHPMQITLDADEVLDPRAYDTVRFLAKEGKCGLFHRLNYWKDPQHLAPENRACGTMVARMGPTRLYMPSDEPNPAVHPNVRTEAVRGKDLFIHHLGFLRKPDAFLRKSAVVQRAFFGSNDARLEKHEKHGTDWRKDDYFDGLPLQPATEPIPQLIWPWLKERGYDV